MMLGDAEWDEVRWDQKKWAKLGEVEGRRWDVIPPKAGETSAVQGSWSEVRWCDSKWPRPDQAGNLKGQMQNAPSVVCATWLSSNEWERIKRRFVQGGIGYSEFSRRDNAFSLGSLSATATPAKVPGEVLLRKQPYRIFNRGGCFQFFIKQMALWNNELYISETGIGIRVSEMQ